jgi:hypothetical protein
MIAAVFEMTTLPDTSVTATLTGTLSRPRSTHLTLPQPIVRLNARDKVGGFYVNAGRFTNA